MNNIYKHAILAIMLIPLGLGVGYCAGYNSGLIIGYNQKLDEIAQTASGIDNVQDEHEEHEDTFKIELDQYKTDEFELDISNASPDDAYIAIYQVMNDIEGYEGKKIKIKGVYSANIYDKDDKWYHFVNIFNSEKSAHIPVEFVPPVLNQFKEGTNITISGTVHFYEAIGDEENEKMMYMNLIDVNAY